MLHLLLLNAPRILLGMLMMSFIEYATHRWLLHKSIFVRMFPNSRKLYETLEDHVVKHHGRFYKCFNQEHDEEGKFAGLFFPLGYYFLLLIFIALPLAFIDWLSALWFVVFAFGHFFGWNEFHKSMHFDKQPAPIWRPWFDYVEYYHFLHHQHPSRNFNGWLPPFWDVILRTSAVETANDREVWRRIRAGELIDRRGRALPL